MKKLLCSTLLLSLFTATAVSAKKPANAEDYLFVQMAPTATLSKDQNADTYKLQLNEASPYVKFFSNRPARITGMMPIDKFLTEWQQNFSQNTPNAGVYGIQDQKPISVMVELSNPTYNADQKTLTYTAKPLKNEKSLSTDIELKDAAIFIDDFCASCSGNGF